MTSPNIWAPGTAISANNSLKSQSFVASAGQTVFTLTAFLYVVSTGSLQVYVGGLHQRSGIDFNETSPNSFTLTTGVSAGTIVTAVAAVEVSGSVDLAGAIAALEAHKLATSTHGVGTVVGATETQTLSNKTLVNPSVSDGTFVGPTLTSPVISGGSASDTLFENVQISEATINGFYLTGSYAPIAVVDGGTGASSAETARANLGLDDIFVGMIAHFPLSSAPTGWLKANGAAVSRATYAKLFARLGTLFGAGNGSTTFNLPDLRGEFVRGLDDGRGVDAGRALGSAQADALKSHTHTLATNGASNGNNSNYFLGGAEYSAPSTATTAATGGTETRPRNVALLACIKY